jgi:hypothetical protein
MSIKTKEPSITAYDTSRGKKNFNSVTGFKRDQKSKSMGRKDDLPDLKKPV